MGQDKQEVGNMLEALDPTSESILSSFIFGLNGGLPLLSLGQIPLFVYSEILAINYTSIVLYI